ncbi:uncharacterized protein B0I36DRAFT_354443 [Microdochium trichocladiopsis]|uniref:Uncharacterized protein n=1 Tax=Microdochium trichocladiopsis TaxID=1682393 RepID=A0A9P8XX87_9PEZI|nr:uncharacterized protein B0I36DRAFT_354443 [Microdochium trichocladiopsis]KAH7018133.1 hypothetical protein B0I36DRAFT_354443 [Microdochium trichocladiopsis]
MPESSKGTGSSRSSKVAQKPGYAQQGHSLQQELVVTDPQRPDGIDEEFWRSMVNFNSDIEEGPYEIIISCDVGMDWPGHYQIVCEALITRLDMDPKTGVPVPNPRQLSKRLTGIAKKPRSQLDEEYQGLVFIVFRFHFESGVYQFDVPSFQKQARIKVHRKGRLPKPMVRRYGGLYYLLKHDPNFYAEFTQVDVAETYRPRLEDLAEMPKESSSSSSGSDSGRQAQGQGKGKGAVGGGRGQKPAAKLTGTGQVKAVDKGKGKGKEQAKRQ